MTIRNYKQTVVILWFLLWNSMRVFALPPQPLYPILKDYVKDLYKEFRKIPEERRYRLNEIARFVRDQKLRNQPASLLFITTNQSTIGQLAQVWAQTAAFYYGVATVKSYSGGLKPELVSEEMIFALERAGFIVYKTQLSGGSVYKVKYSYNLKPVIIFSKKINHARNPSGQFMAIFLEPNADVNLPEVPGAVKRLSIYYEDPEGYDGTPQEKKIYDDRCHQIALEMFYVFSQLKHL